MDKLEQYLEQFIQYCRYERQLSDHTVTNYQRDILKFNQFLKLISHQGKLAHFTIQQWLSKSYQDGISAKSLARYLASLRSFFHYLIQKNLLDEDPTIGVKTPKVGKSLPKTLDIDQVQSILNTPQTDPLAVRDLAIMELLYSSGLRISELINSDLNHLDLHEGLIRVTGKGDKDRIVPVGQMALNQIKLWLDIRTLWNKTDEAALFISQSGSRLTARAVQKRIKDWAVKLGLDTNLHPHKFRHSVASHLLESSGDLRAVQEFLGHANLTTTQIYTQLDFQHLAKTYDAAHPRAKNKKS
jgi:integrase/recombinase XerC